jgi:hypothetical protein
MRWVQGGVRWNGVKWFAGGMKPLQKDIGSRLARWAANCQPNYTNVKILLHPFSSFFTSDRTQWS